jgi:hypothetical protein
LLNKGYVREYLNFDAMWARSHGSDHVDFLGSGLLYYSLAYMSRARLCVCLGSGGGFVPRLMRQAQRDLGLSNAKTVLIDADIGSYGRPFWKKAVPLPRRAFFIRQFPEIEIIKDLTSNVANAHRDTWKIDYLHIDADHSYAGSLRDFEQYRGLMSKDGVITFHDTREGRFDCWRAIKAIRNQGHEVVNFPHVGAGFAIIKPRRP